jgi:hypothetical protein
VGSPSAQDGLISWPHRRAFWIATNGDPNPRHDTILVVCSSVDHSQQDNLMVADYSQPRTDPTLTTAGPRSDQRSIRPWVQLSRIARTPELFG